MRVVAIVALVLATAPATPASAQSFFVRIDTSIGELLPGAVDQLLIELRADHPDMVFALSPLSDDDWVASRGRPDVRLTLRAVVLEGEMWLSANLTSRTTLPGHRSVHETFPVSDAPVRILSAARSLLDGVTLRRDWRTRRDAPREPPRLPAYRLWTPPSGDPIDPRGSPRDEPPRPPLRWRRNGALVPVAE